MQKKLSIKDLDLKDKKVLMRVDFNVPMDTQGTITDDMRIKAALPSIHYVLKQGGSLILMSHLGRPKGTIAPEFSLAPCAKRLSELLNQPVLMAPDCIGPTTEKMAKALLPGQVLFLENLRFHEAEEKPELDPNFARALANLADIYVDEAFGAAHRKHASIVEVARYFPGKAAAGFLMEKEIAFLGEAVRNPKRPFYAIIGGAKISTKIGVLKALLKKVDAILIGGGMAYTFFKAQGIAIGNSIHEDALIDRAKDILAAASSSKPIYLPVDNVVVAEINDKASMKVIDTKQGIPDGFQGVDIGPKTIEQYKAILNNAGTVFWNGPMGIFEFSHFAVGTNAIAHTLAQLTNAVTIVGGGESVAAVEAAGVVNQITHISTGGGATLEYIEFGTLPGIDALSDKSEGK